MVGVDVSSDLEDEAGELGFLGTDHALFGFGLAGTGGYLHEAVEQLLHTEVVEGGAEEDGGDLSRAVGLDIKLGVDAVDKLQVLA